jgi:hypothetical protein
MAEIPSWHITGDWFDNCSGAGGGQYSSASMRVRAHASLRRALANPAMSSYVIDARHAGRWPRPPVGAGAPLSILGSLKLQVLAHAQQHGAHS